MGIEEKEKLLPPLKVCPFCKSSAKMDWHIDCVCVKCSNPECGCQSPDYIFAEHEDDEKSHMTAVMECAEETVRKWNRREILTNRDKLQDLKSEELYYVLYQVYNVYGKTSIQSSTAITEWFDKPYTSDKDTLDYVYIWSVLDKLKLIRSEYERLESS